MELFSRLLTGFEFVADPLALATICAGVAFGIFVGAMPGLSPSMGVALLVPFTYGMAPTPALVLLTAVYLAADYGGSITAVTINAPGTPSAAVTLLDGYPLTLQGKAGEALGVSLVASTVGGTVGTLMLIFFAEPLSRFALQFRPADYFAVAIFGLTAVASLGGKHRAKALFAALIGLLLNCVGIDPISGAKRFTFGITHLYDGFKLVPVLIGLFALSEIFLQLEQRALESSRTIRTDTSWPRWREHWLLRWNILRSSVIGTLIGIFPGAGATVASFVSYDVAKRFSRKSELFGRGAPEGVAAAEAANSSSVGGALVPLLTLGIPGSASTAVLLGALMIHAVEPGPRLVEEHPQVVYGLFASLLTANLVLLVLGLAASRLWIRVAYIPKQVLVPLILVVSVAGSFAVRNTLFDVYCCLAFGLLGWWLRRNQFPVVPIVLGLILGRIAETNFRLAVMQGGYSEFFRQPICLVVLVLAALSLLVPLLLDFRHRPSTAE